MLEFPDNLQSSNGLPSKKAEIRFLNYCPQNKHFEKEEQTIVQDIKRIEQSYKSKVAEMVSNMLNEEKQTLNIIPKKANIDLKRFLQTRLDKLRTRTEKSIVQILNKKLQTDVPTSAKEDQQNIMTDKDDDKSEDKQEAFAYQVYDRAIDFDLDDDYEDDE